MVKNVLKGSFPMSKVLVFKGNNFNSIQFIQNEKKTHNNNNNKDPRSELVKDQNNKKL